MFFFLCSYSIIIFAISGSVYSKLLGIISFYCTYLFRHCFYCTWLLVWCSFYRNNPFLINVIINTILTSLELLSALSMHPVNCSTSLRYSYLSVIGWKFGIVICKLNSISPLLLVILWYWGVTNCSLWGCECRVWFVDYPHGSTNPTLSR